MALYLLTGLLEVSRSETSSDDMLGAVFTANFDRFNHSKRI
jgi:hypothetical protein